MDHWILLDGQLAWDKRNALGDPILLRKAREVATALGREGIRGSILGLPAPQAAEKLIKTLPSGTLTRALPSEIVHPV
jgi:hypothetical protein